MPQPRVLVLRAPGTNCDEETAYAFELSGGLPTALHVNRVLENPRVLADYQILCLPGGFSYGDDLAAGRILGTQLRLHLGRWLQEFKAAGKLILGICNGFQILMRSGLLLDETVREDGSSEPIATLTNNDSARYEDRWVRLRTAGSKCVFFSGIETMYLPVAHGEGKFVARDAATLARLETAGQLCLRYARQDGGSGAAEFPDNPNGAQADVAGVCDASGLVCGLMPHPERHIDRLQHPRWTRGEAAEVGDGLRVFQNAVEYFA
jgi:phosphoribosylformylglycinamidine synthase